MATKAMIDEDLKPGMIVRTARDSHELYEILSIHGDAKELLRREDLELTRRRREDGL